MERQTFTFCSVILRYAILQYGGFDDGNYVIWYQVVWKYISSLRRLRTMRVQSHPCSEQEQNHCFVLSGVQHYLLVNKAEWFILLVN